MLIVGYLRNTEKYKGSNKTTTEILLNLIFFSSCVFKLSSFSSL